MPLIGLFFLPLEANTPSPFAALSQHVSRNLSAQPLPPFSFDFRLLVDTSSLLPGALESRKRRSTQILTLGHFTDKTFILTEPEDSTAPTIISIPSGAAADSFFSMVTSKMQPLWAARSDFRIEKGTSVELSDGEVEAIRVGELRVIVGQGAGKARGNIIEVIVRGDVHEDDMPDPVARDKAIRAALDALLEGSSISTTRAKVVAKFITDQKGEPKPGEIVTLYSDLMRLALPATQR